MSEDPLDIEGLLAEIDALDSGPTEQPEYALASKPQREVTTPEELDEIAETEWPREPDEPCDDGSCEVPEPQDDAQAARTMDPIQEPSEDDIAAYEPFPLPDERPAQAAPAVPDFSDDVWEHVPIQGVPVPEAGELPVIPHYKHVPSGVPVPPVSSHRYPGDQTPGVPVPPASPEPPRGVPVPRAATRREMPQPAAADIPAFAGEQWEDVPLPQLEKRRARFTAPFSQRSRREPATVDFPEFEPDEDLAAQMPSRVRETASSVPEPGDPPGDGPTARAPSTVPQQRDMGVAVTHNVVLSGDRELAEEFAQQLIPALGEMREGILAQVQDMIESNTAILDRSRGVV